MLRRSILTTVLAGLTGNALTPTRADVLDNQAWTNFKTRFVSGEGRILDNGNGGVSHSEGQVWGLIFAVAFDDRADATIRIIISAFGQQGVQMGSMARSSTVGVMRNAAAYFSPVTATSKTDISASAREI